MELHGISVLTDSPLEIKVKSQILHFWQMEEMKLQLKKEETDL